MNNIAGLAFAAAILFWSPADSRAQAPNAITPDLARLTDGRSGQVFNRALTAASEEGRTVARLDARAGDGGVILDGIQLSEGVIEVDLKGKDVAQQSFLGIAFHVVDWTTLEQYGSSRRQTLNQATEQYVLLPYLDKKPARN